MIQKSESFLSQKTVIITKREHEFKGFASTYDVEILNSFNAEVQIKDSESVIKSKLRELLI